MLNTSIPSKNTTSIGTQDLQTWHKKPLYAAIKYVADFLCSLVILAFAAIPMLAIALAVRCTSKGPALFRQERCGKNGKPFPILKFRSMYIEAPADLPPYELANADALITPLGKFLRKTSLDELPQLFNIIAGQMSLIGPRPAQTVNEDRLLTLRAANGADRLRPGLTGWAQVNGRDILAADVEKKAAYDGEYARRRSLWFDMKIFFLTVVKVFLRSDVVEGDTVTRTVPAGAEVMLSPEAEAAAAMDEYTEKPAPYESYGRNRRKKVV